MKKILFILPSLCIGGMERVQVTIANKLADAGYQVTVMTFDEGYDLRGELSDKVRFIHKKPKPFRLMRKIPYIRYKFYDSGLWETRASAKKLYQYYVGDEHYDVEIAFFRGRAVKIISGSTNKESRKIAWVHSDLSKAGSFSANFKNDDEARAAYKQFDKVVCVSKEAEKGFQEKVVNTGNTTTIYNMIPVDTIRRLSLKGKTEREELKGINAIIVGRLVDSTKGHSRLIRALSRVNNEGNSINLTVLGDGPDRNLINQCIRENRASDYIRMIGSKKNPYPYIESSDLLVCASVFEGFPLNVAEAIVLGTPVLSTDCTGPNEILDYGKYGMIVENSEEGLYNGLKQLVENLDLLKEYKEKALQRQDFFDEDKILKQITDLF